MLTILTVAEVVVCLALIGLVLLQQGKGADAGAAFGSGASGTVFGASGGGNFLTRATAVLATLFFALTLTLAYLSAQAGPAPTSVTDEAPASVTDDIQVDATPVPGDDDAEVELDELDPLPTVPDGDDGDALETVPAAELEQQAPSPPE